MVRSFVYWSAAGGSVRCAFTAFGRSAVGGSVVAACGGSIPGRCAVTGRSVWLGRCGNAAIQRKGTAHRIAATRGSHLGVIGKLQRDGAVLGNEGIVAQNDGIHAVLLGVLASGIHLAVLHHYGEALLGQGHGVILLGALEGHDGLAVEVSSV